MIIWSYLVVLFLNFDFDTWAEVGLLIAFHELKL